jgi:hypothetical protein
MCMFYDMYNLTGKEMMMIVQMKKNFTYHKIDKQDLLGRYVICINLFLNVFDRFYILRRFTTGTLAIFPTMMIV